MAYEIAVYLGFQTIVLCGCDCKGDDFYGKNLYHHTKTMPHAVEGLKWMINDARLRGIELLSLSNNEYIKKTNKDVFTQRLPRNYFTTILCGGFDLL